MRPTTLFPPEVIRRPCQDHHFTGPVHAQQSPNQGSVSVIEGEILAAIAEKLGGPVLEIGSDLGISTRYIHEGLGRDPAIWAVDPHHKWTSDVWPGIVQHHKTSVAFRYLLPTHPFRWAFIDGDHRYAGIAADILVCRALLIPVLVFHDTAARLARMPENPSAGSDAHLVVRDAFAADPTLAILDIQTESGLTIVCPPTHMETFRCRSS